MNGSNEILKLNIDVSLFRGMIEDILDEKFKVFESRLQSNSVALTREDASNMLKKGN